MEGNGDWAGALGALEGWCAGAAGGAGAAGAAPGAAAAGGGLGAAFGAVAVGGTFDRLHAGHRLLLAAAALAVREGGTLYLGVSADTLLEGKAHRDLIQGYAERAAAAEAFVRAVHPGLLVAAGPLEDPREPPLAATLREMEALVVSRETTGGADWIQGVRRDLGFAPLRVLVVGLVGGGEGGAKLSSTALREEEAAQGRGPS